MNLIKDLILKYFPGIYLKKNFSELDHVNFSNYKQNNIEPELLLLPFLLDQNKLFIDVGSNKGVFIYAALKKISASHIFGFEPNPILYKKINSVFKGVNLFENAVSNKSGEAILTVPFTNQQPDDSLASLNQTKAAVNAFTFKVRLISLDEFFRDKKTQIGLIKVDVEGHELDVIDGAAEVILKHQPYLIIEIEQRHHSKNITEIINDIICRFSYKAYYFLPAENKLISFSNSPQIYQSKDDFGTINYVNNFIFLPENENSLELVSKINSKIGK